jgi:hypothetical protein
MNFETGLEEEEEEEEGGGNCVTVVTVTYGFYRQTKGSEGSERSEFVFGVGRLQETCCQIFNLHR